MDEAIEIYPEFMCDGCAWRETATNYPNSLLGATWRLHSRVCPQWQAYKTLTNADAPEWRPFDVALLAGGAALVTAGIVLVSRKKG